MFDLDGVVTATAKLHFLSWKRLFDEVLAEQARRTGTAVRPFDETDYRAWVDGRPRSDGLKAFLEARDIALPSAELAGLLERKNVLFAEALERFGVQVHPGAVELIRALRASAVRVGVATSSRNAPRVLKAAGLESLFDALVDGNTSERAELRGKPAPDIFLHCLRLLGVDRADRSVMFEDAASGVAAGRAGEFGLVVGVDRGGNWWREREAGAHVIVRHLAELSLSFLDDWIRGRGDARPNVLGAWRDVAARLAGRRLAIFLDYEGTLTPVVARPELAVISAEARSALKHLAGVWPTHIISGWALADVREKVGLEGLCYVGKGRAVMSLIETLGPGDRLPIYVGDDVTDEDAFAAVRASGMGVLVTDRPKPTAASHSLQNTDEVIELLARLARLGTEGGDGS